MMPYPISHEYYFKIFFIRPSDRPISLSVRTALGQLCVQNVRAVRVFSGARNALGGGKAYAEFARYTEQIARDPCLWALNREYFAGDYLGEHKDASEPAGDNNQRSYLGRPVRVHQETGPHYVKLANASPAMQHYTAFHRAASHSCPSSLEIINLDI